jgi:molybdate transport system permease protein
MDWFPLWLSLRVALLATALALAAGLPLAYLLANREFRGKRILDAAIALPLVLPSTVLAYYLLVLAGRTTPLGRAWEAVFGSPLMFTWKAAVAAALLHSLPLLVTSARAALEGVDRAYERAARNLGAPEWKLFWRVTLPLVYRPMAAAAAVAFARSLGDFGVTLMIAGNLPGQTQTLPVAVYSAVASGHAASALWLVVAMSAIVLGVLALAKRVEAR